MFAKFYLAHLDRISGFGCGSAAPPSPLPGAARRIQKPLNEKGRPQAAFRGPNLIASRSRASPRAAAITGKAQAYDADEQHRPGRGFRNDRPRLPRIAVI
jgi:hypothetical protein